MTVLIIYYRIQAHNDFSDEVSKCELSYPSQLESVSKVSKDNHKYCLNHLTRILDKQSKAIVQFMLANRDAINDPKQEFIPKFLRLPFMHINTLHFSNFILTNQLALKFRIFCLNF